MQRGGQVFFVHNRVQSIHSMEKLLSELVPEVTHRRGARADGRGPAGEGDGRVRGEEVPGAALHLHHRERHRHRRREHDDRRTARTRSGWRSSTSCAGAWAARKERAYAYLLVPARRAVTRDAQRRLEVLQAFTELGAGFSIAIARPGDPRRGQPARARSSRAPSRRSASTCTRSCWRRRWRRCAASRRAREIEPDVTLPLPALIPDDYVPDVHQRLVFYKRFSQAGHAGRAHGPARRAGGPLRRGARRGGQPLAS